MMDKIIRSIQGDIPWYMLFADDVVLVDDRRTGSIGSETNLGIERFYAE
jgi:hypothetical protein